MAPSLLGSKASSRAWRGRPEPWAGDHEPPTTMLRNTRGEMDSMVEYCVYCGWSCNYSSGAGPITNLDSVFFCRFGSSSTSTVTFALLSLTLCILVEDGWTHLLHFDCPVVGMSTKKKWCVCVCTHLMSVFEQLSHGGGDLSVSLLWNCRDVTSWQTSVLLLRARFNQGKKENSRAGWPRFDNVTLVSRFIYVLHLLAPSLSFSIWQAKLAVQLRLVWNRCLTGGKLALLFLEPGHGGPPDHHPLSNEQVMEA